MTGLYHVETATKGLRSLYVASSSFDAAVEVWRSVMLEEKGTTKTPPAPDSVTLIGSRIMDRPGVWGRRPGQVGR